MRHRGNMFNSITHCFDIAEDYGLKPEPVGLDRHFAVLKAGFLLLHQVLNIPDGVRQGKNRLIR